MLNFFPKPIWWCMLRLHTNHSFFFVHNIFTKDIWFISVKLSCGFPSRAHKTFKLNTLHYIIRNSFLPRDHMHMPRAPWNISWNRWRKRRALRKLKRIYVRNLFALVLVCVCVCVWIEHLCQKPWLRIFLESDNH